MTVTLTPRAEELLEAARASGLGGSPEEIIERALEAVTHPLRELSAEERARRRQAVAAMQEFAETHQLTLGRAPGVRIRELLHEGHKY